MESSKQIEPLGEEVWKPLTSCKYALLGRFMISNHGQLKSLPTSRERTTWRGGSYTSYFPGKILAQRHSKKSPLLISTISRTLIDGNGEPLVVSESIYIHKAVAHAFLEPPKDKKMTIVRHIDHLQPQLNIPVNLAWCTLKEMSAIVHQHNPHMRWVLRDTNIKSGYYKKFSELRKQNKWKDSD